MKAKKRYLQVNTLSGYKGPPFRRLVCRFDYTVGGHVFQLALTHNWEGSVMPLCITHVRSGKQIGHGLDLKKPRNNEATKQAAVLYVDDMKTKRGEANFIARLLLAENDEVLEPVPVPEGICL